MKATIRPEEEMKESNVEYLGKVPANWSIANAKFFVTITNGSDPKTEGNTPVYGSGCKSFRTCGEFKNGPAVLLGRKGTIDNPQYVIGKYWNVDTAFDVKAMPRFNLKFYYYLSMCFDYKHYSTQTALPSMTQSNYRNMPIVVPHDEQQMIVNYLDAKVSTVDSIISEAQKSIEEYKGLKQAIITEAVTKGLDKNAPMKDSGIDWLKTIPSNWEVKRGKNLFVETNIRSTTGKEELLTVSQYTGVTPRSEKNVNMFEALSLVDYKICEVGDIAANTMWMWAGAVGVSKYYGIISPSYNTYRQIEKNYDPAYLDYLLRIPNLVQEYESWSTGIRSSRLRLYPTQFLNIRFPVPPISEQQDIVQYLRLHVPQIDALVSEKQSLVDELQAYKKSLIYEVVTGKRKVVS